MNFDRRFSLTERDPEEDGNPTPQNVFYTCIKTFLERIAPVLVDASSMKTLITLVTASVDGTAPPVADQAGERGRQLLLVRSWILHFSVSCSELYGILYENYLLIYCIFNGIHVFINILVGS